MEVLCCSGLCPRAPCMFLPTVCLTVPSGKSQRSLRFGEWTGGWPYGMIRPRHTQLPEPLLRLDVPFVGNQVRCTKSTGHGSSHQPENTFVQNVLRIPAIS